MAKDDSRKDQKLSKAAFDALEVPLRRDLLDCQSRLMDEDFPVVVVINGVDAKAGNEVLNALFEWFDPRYLLPHALRPRTSVERLEPFLRRYWKRVPPDGRVAVFLGGAVLEAFTELRRGKIDLARFGRLLVHSQRMERQLVAEGTHAIKLWVGKAPGISEDDPAVQLYRGSNWELAEWKVVTTKHSRNRRIEAGRAVADSIRRRLSRGAYAPAAVVLPPDPKAPQLAQVDLSSRLERSVYQDQKGRLQKKLAKLSARCAKKNISAVLAFEGWDAAGKGGAIRRLTQAMDARNYRVVPIAAPSPEEKRRPHLWRFWLSLPHPGGMTLYDRSWYGRVLVERVEGFAAPHDWQRAYAEINDFEEQLADKGYALCKFWLHLDPDEQLRRFQEREQTAYKQYKITEEDYRNRERWDDYVVACDDMLARTSTERAPWTLVAANDKYHARIRVLETVCDSLERALL